MCDNNEKKNRQFILSETVTQSSVQEIIKQIREINKHDDEQDEKKKEYERKPIELIVNTFGGSVYDGFALVAAMDMSKTPIHTICLGKAMSMGFMIMAAGHQRFMHPLATLMYHQISTMTWDKLEGIKQEVKECERLEAMYDGYVLKKTNLMQEKLDEVKQRKAEWYIGADDAKKLGIIDEVL